MMGTAPASAGARRGLFGAGDVAALSGNPFAALVGAEELPIRLLSSDSTLDPPGGTVSSHHKKARPGTLGPEAAQPR